jgi:hypothetical protein
MQKTFAVVRGSGIAAFIALVIGAGSPCFGQFVRPSYARRDKWLAALVKGEPAPLRK